MKNIYPAIILGSFFIFMIIAIVIEGQYSVNQHLHKGLDNRIILITQVRENFPWDLTNCPPVIELIDDIKATDTILAKQRKKEADNFIKILKNAE